MRVLIDGNSLVLRTGATHLSGIGRSVFELCKAIDALHPDDPSVSVLTQTFRGRIASEFAYLRRKNLLWPIGPRFDRLRSALPCLEVLARHDLLHVPHNFGPMFRPSRTVLTIHDAIFFTFPEDRLGHRSMRKLMPKAAQACRMIAAPSESARRDIVEYLGVAQERVVVIPWGVDASRFRADDKVAAAARVRSQFRLQRPYFFSASCSTGRKNTLTTLMAFRHALAIGCEHDFVVAWPKPEPSLLQEFSAEITSGRLVVAQHVTDALLADLYAGAAATFFPSRYEGFGFPVLESMSCGTPVVTCANSSLVEVGGDVALYVEPDDIDAMAELMRGFAPEPDAELTRRCVTHAAGFRWETTAKRYLDFYRAALEV